MDIWILNMIKNKNCGIPEKIFMEFIMTICIIGIPLAFVDIFIVEVCYDTSIWEIVKKIIILSAIILIVVIKVRKFIYSKINRISLECNKKLIHASFIEFRAIGNYGRISCTYHIVSYYMEGNTTYQFECEIHDMQDQVCEAFKYIKKKGVFPEKVDVYVDSTNYNNYQMQIYEFLDATLKMNRELAEYAYENIEYGIDIGRWKREKEARERK